MRNLAIVNLAPFCRPLLTVPPLGIALWLSATLPALANPPAVRPISPISPVTASTALSSSSSSSSAIALSRNGFTDFRVVIDPGHGGSDHGAEYSATDNSSPSGNGRTPSKPVLLEKDLTLLISKLIVKELQENGVVALLTRNQDFDLSLASRTHFANQIQAQVFLSIHLNSAPRRAFGQRYGFRGAMPPSEGTETFILNQATDASSRRLAHLENSVLGEARNHTNDPSVAMILKDLRLDANRDASRKLACHVQKNAVRAARKWKNTHLNADGVLRHLPSTQDRGIKEALFHVLLGADMPGALLETGFINHPNDRALLTSASGQKVFAKAVAQAILEYRRDYFRALKNPSKLPTSPDSCR